MGFTAQQAAEKLLKAWIVLAADRQPPRVHDLADLASLAGQTLPTSREQLLELLEREWQRCEQRVLGRCEQAVEEAHAESASHST